MALLLLYIGLALGLSFLCSVLEAVLLSVTPSYVARLEREGRASGRSLRHLKAQVDRPLAAILGLNTVAHTVGAAGAGAQAQTLWGAESLAVASGLLTLLILIGSEIIPKTLGAVYWRQLAPVVARALPPMVWALYPLVLLSEGLTYLMTQKGTRKGGGVSREEIEAMAILGAEQGTLGEPESRVLRNMFRSGSLRAHDIMTPRTVLVSLNAEATLREVLQGQSSLTFSRLPVWRKDKENIVGYVLKDQLLLHAAKDELDRRVEEFLRRILVAPDSLPVPLLLERMLDRREQIALVVDEYGGVEGVATMEDIVETLLGMEIIDEEDQVRSMREMARNRWFERARRLGLVTSELPEPPPRDDALSQKR